MSRRRSRFKARSIRLTRRPPFWLLVLVAALILLRYGDLSFSPTPPESLSEGTYAVQRVVDGDTLVLANQARVRLIGVDTPETKHPDLPVEPFGPEAAEFTRRFVADAGGSVRLEFDRERVDRYDRFLAYVWAGDRMLNEELVRAGLATAATQYRYSEAMKRRFRRAEDEARAAGRGIWSLEPVAGSL
jgi:micrococcal nuclease